MSDLEPEIQEAQKKAFAFAGSQMRRRADKELQSASTANSALVENSEDSLALQFATQHEERFRYSPGMEWLYFDGTRWIPDSRLRRYTYSRLLCRTIGAGLAPKQATKLTAANTISAVISLARSDQRLVVDADQWDSDPRIINTPLGIVNLLTGDVHQTVYTDLVTRVTEVPPIPGDAPSWERFLDSVFLGDKAVIEFIQVMLGYCLTGSTREHKLFFFYGKGANGKSTLLDLVEWLLGDYSLKLPASVLMQSKHSTHPTELAQLQGRRLATSSEIEDGQYWAESRIKELTGDEMLSARFMRQDFFQFRQTQKHIICGNYRPRLKGGDMAMQRRMVLIPFAACFEGEKQDKQLPDKLKDEGPQILAWIIEGAVRWAQEGLVIPQSIQAASAEYMLAMDDLAEWAEDCCDFHPDFKESNKHLFASFSAWKLERAEKVPGINTWSERMRQQLRLEPYRTKAGRGFAGISLSDDEVTRLKNRESI